MAQGPQSEFDDAAADAGRGVTLGMDTARNKRAPLF